MTKSINHTMAGYLAKPTFLSRVEACVKIYHNHMVDISKLHTSLTGSKKF